MTDNEKIAKLKNICLHEIEHNDNPRIGEGGPKWLARCKHCHTNLRDCNRNPDWQNNIADAWELFEEMNQGNLRRLNNWIFVLDNCRTFIAKTAPEAICKAYIAWRENE